MGSFECDCTPFIDRPELWDTTKTDGCCECFSSKCPLILEDLRTDVKLIAVNGQGEEQQTCYGFMEL